MTAELRRSTADERSRERRGSSGAGGSPVTTAVTGDADRAASGAHPDVAFDELLELLGDEYACEILRALKTGPMAARELVEECDMSRPTVYRRLNRLVEAGIADSRMRLEEDGHHRKEFHLVFAAFELRVEEDGIDGHIRVGSPDDG